MKKRCFGFRTDTGTTADGNMIYTERDDKFKSEVVTQVPSFRKHMKLTIFSMEERDFGGYKCVAKNPIGEIEGQQYSDLKRFSCSQNVKCC